VAISLFIRAAKPERFPITEGAPSEYKDTMNYMKINIIFAENLFRPILTHRWKPSSFLETHKTVFSLTYRITILS